jgi:hypothetical protein
VVLAEWLNNITKMLKEDVALVRIIQNGSNETKKGKKVFKNLTSTFEYRL